MTFVTALLLLLLSLKSASLKVRAEILEALAHAQGLKDADPSLVLRRLAIFTRAQFKLHAVL